MQRTRFDAQAAANESESWVSDKLDIILRSNLLEITNQFVSGEYASCLKRCDVVIDYLWEKLNTGHWSDIKDLWRHLYYVASVYKAHCQIELEICTEACVKTCDMGLLMGMRPDKWRFSLTDLAFQLCKGGQAKQKLPPSPEPGTKFYAESD